MSKVQNKFLDCAGGFSPILMADTQLSTKQPMVEVNRRSTTVQSNPDFEKSSYCCSGIPLPCPCLTAQRHANPVVGDGCQRCLALEAPAGRGASMAGQKPNLVEQRSSSEDALAPDQALPHPPSKEAAPPYGKWHIRSFLSALNSHGISQPLHPVS